MYVHTQHIAIYSTSSFHPLPLYQPFQKSVLCLPLIFGSVSLIWQHFTLMSQQQLLLLFISTRYFICLLYTSIFLRTYDKINIFINKVLVMPWCLSTDDFPGKSHYTKHLMQYSSENHHNFSQYKVKFFFSKVWK